MRSFFLILRREIQERLRSKPFRLFTAGLFVLALGAVVAIDKAPELFGENALTLGILSSTPEALSAAIEELSLIEDIEVDLVAYESVEEAEGLLHTNELDALLADDRLIYSSSDNTTLTAVVNRAVFATDLVQILDDLGLTDQERREVLTPSPIGVALLEPGPAEGDERQFIGFVAAIALFMTMTFYGNWILTGVVEEKSSRVVEVLLGLVHPHELLAGKRLGILTVAVGQLAVAIAGGAAGLIVIGAGSLPSVAGDVVLVAVPLYVLDLLLLACSTPRPAPRVRGRRTLRPQPYHLSWGCCSLLCSRTSSCRITPTAWQRRSFRSSRSAHPWSCQCALPQVRLQLSNSRPATRC